MGTSTGTEPGSSSGGGGSSSGGSVDSTSSTGEPDTEGSEGSSSTGPVAELPDIDMTVVLEDTINSVYTQTAFFQEDDCEVVEMCALGSGERRLLRFDTITPNLGTVDFYVGNPTNNPDVFDIGCTGQPVYVNYARYRLLSADGSEVVSEGHKAAFALIDVVPWIPEEAGPAQYGFGEDMGISVAWADIYNAGLPCQYVDITGVPAGDYQLEISINADEEIEEATFDNNLLLVPVTIADEP